MGIAVGGHEEGGGDRPGLELTARVGGRQGQEIWTRGRQAETLEKRPRDRLGAAARRTDRDAPAGQRTEVVGHRLAPIEDPERLVVERGHPA